jgi:hypothetical protein
MPVHTGEYKHNCRVDGTTVFTLVARQTERSRCRRKYYTQNVHEGGHLDAHCMGEVGIA